MKNNFDLNSFWQISLDHVYFMKFKISAKNAQISPSIVWAL